MYIIIYYTDSTGIFDEEEAFLQQGNKTHNL